MVSTVKHRGGSMMVWAAILRYSILLVPLLPFMAESVQGGMWTGASHDSDVISERCSFPIHTAGNDQSWFEEYEGELQHLPWPTQSPDLNITEPLSSFLETRVWNKSPPPTSLKQLEGFL
jgi:hypothetical protein